MQWLSMHRFSMHKLMFYVTYVSRNLTILRLNQIVKNEGNNYILKDDFVSWHFRLTINLKDFKLPNFKSNNFTIIRSRLSIF